MANKYQTIVFLMRHGQTDRLYSTDPDIDGQRVLTEGGRVQMRKTGEYLASFSPVALYSSPLLRTHQCAEIIQKSANIPGELVLCKELVEVYSSADYRSVATRMPEFFEKLVSEYGGSHVVCVSHQDVIQGALDCYDLTEEEKGFPCLMGEGYRLVFAGKELVECQKVKPAGVMK